MKRYRVIFEESAQENVRESYENEEFSEEIRQMIAGRYRVLFTIKGRNVHVLHVRGTYVDSAR